MSEQYNIGKDNQDWLDILTGKKVPDADPKIRFEANVIKLGLALQEENLSKSNDDEGFQKVVARLKNEGYLKSNSEISPKPNFIQRWKIFFTGKDIISLSKGPQLVWIFSIFFLSVTIVFFANRYGNSGKNEFGIEKAGPPYTIYVLDSKPEQKAQDIYQQLNNIGNIEVEFRQNQYDENILKIEVRLSEAQLSETQAQQLNNFLVGNDWHVPAGFDLILKITSLYVNYRFHVYPQEYALELQNAFSQIDGVQVETTQVHETLWRLDIHLPETDSEALLSLLEEHNLEKSDPSERFVRVEIETEIE